MMPPPPPPTLLVMAKWWQRGPVKTRLAAALGSAAARELYRRMVERVWAQLASPHYRRTLCFTPANAAAAMAAWLPGADRYAAQVEGDLGRRLEAAFTAAFAQGAPWVAVIGSDAPAIDAAWVEAAAAKLAEADVVLTPSLDGGYALLALKAPQPSLFEGIPWSTAEVAAITCRRAEASGLKVHQTAPVRDLDDVEDLHALRADGLLPPP